MKDSAKKHCKLQEARTWHGRVDGPIPEAKLLDFRRAAANAAAKSALDAGTLPEASAAPAASPGATQAGAGSARGSGRGAPARARAAPQGGVDCAGGAAAADGALDAAPAASASAVPPLPVETASGGDGASTAGGRGTLAGADSGRHRTCTRFVHVCREDSRLGCQACSKTCHRDNASPLCEFQGRVRLEPLPEGGGALPHAHTPACKTCKTGKTA